MPSSGVKVLLAEEREGLLQDKKKKNACPNHCTSLFCIHQNNFCFEAHSSRQETAPVISWGFSTHRHFATVPELSPSPRHREGALWILVYCPHRLLRESHNLCPHVFWLPALYHFQSELCMWKSLMRCLWSQLPRVLCGQSWSHITGLKFWQGIMFRSLLLVKQSDCKPYHNPIEPQKIAGNHSPLRFLLDISTPTNSLNLSTNFMDPLVIRCA